VKLEAPASVILYGGTGPLQEAIGKLVGLAKKATPQVPDLSQAVAPAFQNEWRLKDPNAVDTKKPLRFAVFDPKAYGPLPTALIVGMSSQDAFVKALPEHDQKKDDAGNAWSYKKFKGASRPIYVNFIGDSAVVTRHPDAFPKHKAFLEALAKAPMAGVGTAWIEVDHLTTIFKGELDAGFKQMEGAMQMAAQMQPGGEASAAMVKTMATWIQGAIGDAAQARITLEDRPDGARLSLSADAKPGSKLAQQLTAIKGTGAHQLLAKVPGDSVAVVTMAGDPTALKDLARGMMNLFLADAIFGGDKAKAEPYLVAMEEYMAATTGELAFAAFPGSNGVEMGMMFGVKDAAKVRSSFEKFRGLYDDPAAKAYYEKMGMTMSWQPDAYEVAGTKASIISTQMTNLPPQAAQMMAMMGDFMTQHFAVTDEVGVMVYGKEAKPVMEGLLTGKVKGGADAIPSVKRALGEAAPKALFFAWINPIALARSIKLGGMNPMAAMLADVKAENGLAISVASEGAGMQLVIDVPLDLVKEGLAAFEKSKG
ncbi:MAG: hypothetical protein KC613_19930, partial [Myxococcales bacterium]|nr:hypothetical protein [Myxococcales bacterium]